MVESYNLIEKLTENQPKVRHYIDEIRSTIGTNQTKWSATCIHGSILHYNFIFSHKNDRKLIDKTVQIFDKKLPIEKRIIYDHSYGVLSTGVISNKVEYNVSSTTIPKNPELKALISEINKVYPAKTVTFYDKKVYYLLHLIDVPDEIFFEFLKEFQYPLEFMGYYIKERAKIKQLKHEIAFYITSKAEIVGTQFYGIL